MSAGKLPEGWVETNLQNVASWGSGGTPSRNHDEYYNGNIPWIKTGDLGPKIITNASEYITDAGVQNSSAKFFPKGSVAIAMYGATIGKTSILGIDATTNQACAVGTPLEGITSTLFLYYFLLNEKHAFIKKGKGGAQPNISQTVIKEHIIYLPPLAEQKIIAEKLDTLLAQVDSTKARLEQIPQILKRFRQAVLGAAVSGKLTEDWRNEQGVNFSKWENTFFEKICTEITVGYVGKMLDRYQNEGIPFLRSQNVREFKFSDKNLLYISEKFHKEIFKSRLTPGDLAIVRSGAPGTTCVIPDSLPIANCSDLVIARPSEKLNSYFGCIFMNSNIAKINVSENRVGIAQQHFNVGSMKKMPIHLPPLTEQHEIVRRVEQLFAYADTIEKQVNNALARVNNLTQSILAKAFRGELTAQWRAENPELISGENSAAALLEKIKAERAASGGKKASRKKS